ncbi:class I SAM-dependent methyltransferase [Agromyces bauzanensis]
MPVGSITRGTTNANRLRRIDRWISEHHAFRRAADPLVVDLGYGASGVTTLELAARLANVRPDVEALGLEIDPGRVRTAQAQLDRLARGELSFPPSLAVRFGLGGFEVPTAGGRRPAVIRAFNVLRQYDEAAVAEAWDRMAARLAPGGLLVEGTCDELGRVASWVGVEAPRTDAAAASVPATFTISLRLTGIDRPSLVAERLPKALIHRNVPGERVHELLAALDRAWQVHAPLSVYGPSQRWIRSVETLRDHGWPVRGRARRWRLGELTLDWAAVAPR